MLVGPPGAGKSTVGRLLAGRLGVPFRDTDADVVTIAGKSISDVFLDDGEESFRALEVSAVARALVEHDGVLSLGGGAVLDPDTRSLLADHLVVFLTVGLSDAATRVGFNKNRPVLALNPRATLAALMAERLPLYQQVADLEISTDGRSAREVANELAGRLTGTDRSS